MKDLIKKQLESKILELRVLKIAISSEFSYMAHDSIAQAIYDLEECIKIIDLEDTND